jgi:S-adenosylhomocysteine hydrolase
MGVPEPTTRPPFDREAFFMEMDNNVVLVNASSKRCEFNWDAARNVAPTPITKRGFGHELKNNTKTIRVAADGFPVNFYNAESVPALLIQPVLGMLFVGAQLLVNTEMKPGLNDFPLSEQDRISDMFDRLNRQP